MIGIIWLIFVIINLVFFIIVIEKPDRGELGVGLFFVALGPISFFMCLGITIICLVLHPDSL